MAKEEKRHIAFDLCLPYAPGKPGLVFSARVPDWLELGPGPLADATPEDKSRLADAAMLVLLRAVRNTSCEATFVREGDVDPLQYTFDPKTESKRAHERRREKRRRKEAERDQRELELQRQAGERRQKRKADATLVLISGAGGYFGNTNNNKKSKKKRALEEDSED